MQGAQRLPSVLIRHLRGVLGHVTFHPSATVSLLFVVTGYSSAVASSRSGGSGGGAYASSGSGAGAARPVYTPDDVVSSLCALDGAVLPTLSGFKCTCVGGALTTLRFPTNEDCNFAVAFQMTLS